MKVPTSVPAVPEAVVAAARLRHEGRVAEAADLVRNRLDEARAAAFDTPFRDRVLLALTLADLYLNLASRDEARSLLVTEIGFARRIRDAVRASGSPEQVHAASAGFLQLRDRATQIELLDRPAPGIGAVEWLQGGPVTLRDLRGQVVLFEFWAPWCRSCLAMFAFLNALHHKYGAQGLTIIALTNYRSGETHDPGMDRELVRESLSRNAVDFTVAIAPNEEIRAQYGAHGIPTYALIDRQGYVCNASSKPDKSGLETAISGLLQT
ncbi:TlpA disulfide reductase family protein [Mycolicibacterium sp. BiH015]|uniref:TlpA family protein disulfide reductase n=1 Tax=Mycolicibacterium sp. BiH015 TaxID=3018808 RepID=UPI0022E6DF44|nr:TlpA disulfide reductase family protein [Mycolicibacterium sp. BiH015]MDA2891250.1 TlpA disulfide reductase family protein [Mycolicibacterium sp. BiH015]